MPDKLAEKYKTALQEVMSNLRCIDGPTEFDGYVDDSIEIIKEALKEGEPS